MSDAGIFNDIIDRLHVQREEVGIDLNGKQYLMVKDRVETFRRNWGSELGINTHVRYEPEEGFCIVRAEIADSAGHIKATGTAIQFVGQDEVSSVSFIEACETSAIGRALACFGLHGGEYASSDEINNKRQPQRQEVPPMRHTNINGPKEVKRTLTGLYVPPANPALWRPADVENGDIIDQLRNVSDSNTLAQYWAELKHYTDSLKLDEPALLAELKAAFATANNNVGG